MENINNWVRKLSLDESENFKPEDLYKSKYKENFKMELRKAKSAHRTMGYAKTPLKPPGEFLRKYEGLAKKPRHYPMQRHHDHERKAELPKISATSKISSAIDEKNYIVENALKNIGTSAKIPNARYVDTRNGSSHTLENSGVVPKFSLKKDYGCIPNYLGKIKEEQERSKQNYLTYIEERRQQQEKLVRKLPSEEQSSLIADLKKKLQHLVSIYSRQSITSNSVSVIKYRRQLEVEMKEIEKYIELLERNPVILIAKK